MTARTCGEVDRAVVTRSALAEASRARRCRVLRPRWARKQSKGDGTAPMAFWRKERREWRVDELKAAAPMRTSFSKGRRG